MNVMPISTSVCVISRRQCVVLPVNIHRPPRQGGSSQFSQCRMGVVVSRGIRLGKGVLRSERRMATMRSRAGGVQEVQERSQDGVTHEEEEEEEDGVQTVVIVGAGLAGLATALALHRVGIKALVLEQSGGLRTEGTSLTLFPNAWRVLDVLGVADQLRGSYINCVGARIRTSKGKVIKEFLNSDFPGGPHELRAVERQSLLRALAESLPSDTILFNSRVKNIRKLRDTQLVTEVELDNNTTIRTKVLVGCDGARSVVASWMGLSEPRPIGQMAIRGLSEFKSGHNFEPRVEQLIGQGVRAGMVPVSKNKVYWFVLFNITSSVPSRISDPLSIKEEAMRYMQGWPRDIQECIEMTPLEGFNRSSLKDRWAIPLITPQQAGQGITLAGDAAHPMTPNLAQGGCTSLEDAVVLARKLCEALRSSHHPEPEAQARSLGGGLAAYEAERWGRTFGLTVKSFVFGWFLALDLPPVCFVRDTWALPLAFRASLVFASAKFDCGALPPPLDSSLLEKKNKTLIDTS